MLEPTAKEPVVSYTGPQLAVIVLVLALLFLGLVTWINYKNHLDLRGDLWKLESRVLQLELDRCKEKKP